MTTLYIAGPMTSMPDLNYPQFFVAAAQLRRAGFTVLNPAENEAPNENPSWSDWMRLALAQLVQADGIALLQGWRESRGAQLEKELAVDLGLQLGTVPNWLTKASNEAHMERLGVRV
ncbi:DUF4406 domain-containing protein [Arthrobacter sp. USHLN218]|uniref:DUF4406 domain-containing protein n=1 Tax=Arthrobacter sp. USHLN218 TaxID=3081232 RepID=UPI00301604EB